MCTVRGFTKFPVLQRTATKIMQPNINYTIESTINRSTHTNNWATRIMSHCTYYKNGPTQYAVLHSAVCLPDHVQNQIQIDKISTNTVLTLSARRPFKIKNPPCLVILQPYGNSRVILLHQEGCHERLLGTSIKLSLKVLTTAHNASERPHSSHTRTNFLLQLSHASGTLPTCCWL
jgi:hypothetical protein